MGQYVCHGVCATRHSDQATRRYQRRSRAPSLAVWAVSCPPLIMYLLGYARSRSHYQSDASRAGGHHEHQPGGRQP